MIEGIIYDIQHYSIHDGPGIRTLVFLKGCPLRCWWCSNPESQFGEAQLIHSRSKCVECKRCTAACPASAITWEPKEGVHVNRAKCDLCGACIEQCYSGGMKMVGQSYSFDSLLADVLKDEVFYQTSGGGVTVGGGEPLYQPEFLKAFLQACRDRLLPTAVETCGYAPSDTFREIAGLTDLLLMDLKHVDEKKHFMMTGVSNAPILANWELVSKTGTKVVGRVPVIPGFNDTEGELLDIGKFLHSVGCTEMHLLPYHRLGEGKYPGLDRKYLLEGVKPLSDEEVGSLTGRLQEVGLQVQVGG